jgi:hypothetical protein
MCSISFVFTNSQTELCNCYHVAPLHLQQILAAQTSVECRVCMANLARFQSLPTTQGVHFENGQVGIDKGNIVPSSEQAKKNV